MKMESISLLVEMEKKMGSLITSMHNQNLASKPSKAAPKLYTMKEASKLIGRTYTAIREAEKSGKLPPPEMGPNNRRVGYTLKDINRARELFKTRLRRDPNKDDCIRLSFSNLKGGSAKTSSAVHAAQYLAEAGLRVLLVDCDPQASATTTMGYNPDSDIDEQDTLLPYLEAEAPDLSYAIRSTFWPGLDLIPANLKLFSAEYVLAREASPIALQRLRSGLESVEENYDVIILDPAPSLGLLCLSVMNAANAIVIPSPASSYDMYSTRSFLTMLIETMDTLENLGMEVDLKFVKLMVTRLDENSEIQVALAEILPDHLGVAVLRNAVRKTAALDRAGLHGRTIYEMSAENMPRKTWTRALTHFNRANNEILTLIKKSWPSYKSDLRNGGTID